jgi:hypothetical protein
MLFDWLVTGQVVPMNPAAAVRGPKHIVKTGKTPVLEDLEEMPILSELRDRQPRTPKTLHTADGASTLRKSARAVWTNGRCGGAA